MGRRSKSRSRSKERKKEKLEYIVNYRKHKDHRKISDKDYHHKSSKSSHADKERTSEKSKHMPAKIAKASNPDNPLEKVKIMDSLNSTGFSSQSFVSSKNAHKWLKKAYNLAHSDIPQNKNKNSATNFSSIDALNTITASHDTAMFAPYKAALKVKEPKENLSVTTIDLDSIQLPSLTPKSFTLSNNSDAKWLIHKKFHVSEEEKLKQWQDTFTQMLQNVKS